MKKIYFLLLSLFFIQSAFAYTVREKQAYDIRLKNGLYMNVAVCTDGIFRVRITPRQALEESLMERYGIIVIYAMIFLFSEVFSSLIINGMNGILDFFYFLVGN